MAGAPTVLEAPTVGHPQASGVPVAQVVAVGVAVEGQIVEPDHTAGVLVGERRGGGLGTSRT